MKPRSVAIIPARGGSKRIPRKNIKSFNGKPMIAYPISAAIRAEVFERIIVSTDDEEIAEVATKLGAEVPFTRPAELADDFTGTTDVIEHALEWLEEHDEPFDYLCTLYATTPFLRPAKLREGLELLQSSDATSAISVASMPFPVHRTFQITSNNRLQMFWPEHFNTRSQDLPEAYQDAGQFYWTHLERADVEPKKRGFGAHVMPVVLPRYVVQDIDTQEDWAMAELMYQVLKAKDWV